MAIVCDARVATPVHERPNYRRKIYHHLTFYGFVLCFAATCVATLYHYFLAREAPYPWWDLPVVLGTLGGVGLVVGPVGLFLSKTQRDPALLEWVKGRPVSPWA